MKFPIFALTWTYKITKLGLQQRNNGLNLKETELDQLLDGATAKSTKYATTYAVTVFKGEKQFLLCEYNSSRMNVAINLNL